MEGSGVPESQKTKDQAGELEGLWGGRAERSSTGRAQQEQKPRERSMAVCMRLHTAVRQRVVRGETRENEGAWLWSAL